MAGVHRNDLSARDRRVHLALQRWRDRPVAITAGANAPTVTEHTLLLMLSRARGIDHQRAPLVRADWRDYQSSVQSVELYQATLGIIGLGAIGIEVARRAAGFGTRLIACSRTPKPELEAEG